MKKNIKRKLAIAAWIISTLIALVFMIIAIKLAFFP